MEMRAATPKAMNFGGIIFITRDMERRAAARSYIWYKGVAAYRHLRPKSNVSFGHSLDLGQAVQAIEAERAHLVKAVKAQRNSLEKPLSDYLSSVVTKSGYLPAYAKIGQWHRPPPSPSSIAYVQPLETGYGGSANLQRCQGTSISSVSRHHSQAP